jgi:hypothetical protein
MTINVKNIVVDNPKPQNPKTPKPHQDNPAIIILIKNK